MSAIQDRIIKTLRRFLCECGDFKQAVARTAVRHGVSESAVLEASNK